MDGFVVYGMDGGFGFIFCGENGIQGMRIKYLGSDDDLHKVLRPRIK